MYDPNVATRDQLISVREAASRLGIGRTFTFQLIATGELSSVKIGQRRLIRESDLRAFIDARQGVQVR